MKRKWIALMMAAMMLAGVSGCAGKSAQKVEESLQAESETIIEDVEANVEQMLPLTDAVMCCLLEQGYTYTPEDPQVLWRMIYYVTPEYSDQAVIDGDVMELPVSAVEEIAAALYSGYQGLPDISVVQDDRIGYNAEKDVYRFGLGDRGLSDYEMMNFATNEDGSVTMKVRLFDVTDDTTICEGTFVLQPNGGADGPYKYAISAAEIDAKL